MKRKRKELSNHEILEHYEESRQYLKKKTTKLIEITDKEASILSDLRKRFELNEHNDKLLSSRTANLIKFKKKLIELWQETLKEEYGGKEK